MFQLMGGSRQVFFKTDWKKQARLCNNKTKFRSFHTAVDTLQNSKEHLAPTWTPTRDFCWIIHSEVSNTETVAYLQQRFASPHLYALYMNQWASVQWCNTRGKYTRTCTSTRTNTHSQIWSPRSLLLAFSRGKNECGRFYCWKYSRLSRQSSSIELFMQEHCREKGAPPTVKVGF